MVRRLGLEGTVVKRIKEKPYEKAVGLALGSVVSDLGDKQGLRRLAIDPENANALMALYENNEVEIRAVAMRRFGNKGDIIEQAMHNILVAIGRNAATYDPQSEDATKWIAQCAEAEAKRLHERLHSGGKVSRRPGRAV